METQKSELHSVPPSKLCSACEALRQETGDERVMCADHIAIKRYDETTGHFYKLATRIAVEARISLHQASLESDSQFIERLNRATNCDNGEPPAAAAFACSGEYFSHLYRHDGLKDAEIRDRWQAMSDDDRKTVCPSDWGKIETSILNNKGKPDPKTLAATVAGRRNTWEEKNLTTSAGEK